MEIAESGARTRTRPAFAMEELASATSPASSPKRRKISENSTSQGLEFFSSSSLLDRIKNISKETLLPLPTPPAEEERCPFSPVSDESPASCCSSNGSVEVDDERIKFIDLEVQSSEAETSTCNCGDEIRRERRLLREEVGTNLEEVESMEESRKANNSGCVVSTNLKIPTELELEEFFASAEKEIQKGFSDKYNYDIVKDMPLEGRYEWVQLNP